LSRSQVTACQTISGAFFNTAAQSLFENSLHQTLTSTYPAISLTRLDQAGAGGIREEFAGAELDAVLNAYLVGIRHVFAFAIAGAGLSVICALIIPMKRLPDMQKQGSDENTKSK
jgi:hypothetical protein